MRLRVYLGNTQWHDGASSAPMTVAANPAEAASALVRREGLSVEALVVVVPADTKARGAFNWDNDNGQPVFARACARFMVKPDGVATRL